MIFKSSYVKSGRQPGRKTDQSDTDAATLFLILHPELDIVQVAWKVSQSLDKEDAKQLWGLIWMLVEFISRIDDPDLTSVVTKARLVAEHFPDAKAIQPQED